MLKRITIVSALVMLTACNATDGSKGAMAQEKMEKEGMVCEFKKVTGSNRKQRTCMSKELSDQIRRENQQALRSQESKGQTSAGTY